MFHAIRVSAMVIGLGWCSLAAAQSDPAPATTQAQETAADIAYKPLGRDYNNLYRSLTNKGGVAEADHAIIRALRDRAAAFSREFPQDLRGPVMELTLSQWLKDEDLVEDLYAKILQLDPDRIGIRMDIARKHAAQNRYADALDVFGNHVPDSMTDPDAAMLYADCLFAEHRFQQALDAIANLPDPATSTVPVPTADIERLRAAITTTLAEWPEEQSKRQQEEAANDLPRVLLVTSRGQITLELFENEAANTVANFVNLIDQGFYNNTKFHRVIPNFMAQGGDPNTKPGATGNAGEGNPGYYIPDEHDRPDHRMHFAGSLSMAKTEAPNSGGCQFFITVTPTPHLNGKHTVFGRVIEGMEVARALNQDDEVELMTVIRRRQHDYIPATLPLVQPVSPPPIEETPVTDPAPVPIPDPTSPPTDPAAPPADPAVVDPAPPAVPE